jgi:hypothetical protein
MAKRWTIAVAASAVAVATGVAYAAMPDSGGAVVSGPVGTGYQTTGGGTEITAVGPGSTQHVASLTLPPGSYAISAQMTVEKDDGDGTLACVVTTPGLYNAPVGGWERLGTGAGDQTSDEFSGTGLDVLPHGGTATLQCGQFSGPTGSNPFVEQFAFTAVRIVTVNEQ